jgi:hypothetical protein
VGAVGVLTLAFPLHPPGRPDRSRAGELPRLSTLLVQGGRDPFGRGSELREVLNPAMHDVVEVPGADHGLRVSRTAPITQREADEIVVLAVRRWLAQWTPGRAPGRVPGRDVRE